MSDIIKPEEIQSDERTLDALFDELEKKQLDFLDAAGKRIIELTVTLIGINFGIIALGKDFPPAYINGNIFISSSLSIALVFFVAAMVTGMIAIQPRTYKRHRHNLSLMRESLDKMIKYKIRWVKIASVFLALGSVLLVVTVLQIIQNN